ncbi:MAG: PAS domain S-box protein, partial [Candidatus Altiarchaeales archaeon]|nr:PAS domain S-box protein [Candidatus Altiarchaeales archaeon]
ISRLAAIVESSQDAIIAKTLEGTITAWNRGAERIYGYSEREALGKHISMIIAKECENDAQEILEKIRQGKKVEALETLRKTKDGRILHMQLTVSPIKNSIGEVIGASAIARNITQQKNVERQLEEKIGELKRSREAMLNILEDLNEAKEGLEKEVKERTSELRKALKQAKSADHMKDNFLAITSHELKTPLTPIILYTELLKENEALDAENKQYVDTIYQEAIRLRDLILDILDLAKLDANQKQFRMEEASIKKVLEDSIEEVKAMAQTRKIKIILEVGKEIPDAQMDYEAIKKVCKNLLTNAIKFSPEESQIHVKARKNKDKIQVSVKDGGIGIEEDQREKIFDRFYQADSEHNREYGGTGLGLVICKGNINAHKGRIWVESKKEEGSTFNFTLPLN